MIRSRNKCKKTGEQRTIINGMESLQSRRTPPNKKKNIKNWLPRAVEGGGVRRKVGHRELRGVRGEGRGGSWSRLRPPEGRKSRTVLIGCSYYGAE